ncbi:ABC transporter permease [uncultured Marinobacter sp.]|uniref:ABC transporter permease n=1 Tax=uncultured Marinobacter sp. TaxID=187379 RepID=UPI0030DA62EC|tara:strand:+ start:5799 stop:6719 length:921 start_codon:yes stop_codon:yes gene_type:complete
MTELLALMLAAVVAGTPLLYAALGELITERSGILNLGVEGMMVIGAIAGFAAVYATGNLWLGVLAAGLSGGVLALAFGFLAISLRVNHVAAGLALTIFGISLDAYVGKPLVGQSLNITDAQLSGGLTSIPLVGPLFSAVHPLVWISWLLFAGLWYFTSRTRAGLVLRAVGESTASADAIGYPVMRIQYLATGFGGVMAGIAGVFISVVYTSIWTEGIIAGRGWIAVALVIFATWRPGRCLVGAYLFGGMTIAELLGQVMGLGVPTELLSATPYLATVIVLVLISRKDSTMRLSVPASLGKSLDIKG